MNTRVQFKSTAFPKYENENNETVNPHRWGKRLAEFVRDNLPRYGVVTENIICEDWGWLVNMKNDGSPVWIGCGVVDDNSDSGNRSELQINLDGDDMAMTEFCLFVTAEVSLFTRLFKRVDTNPVLSDVVAALEKMVADQGEFHDAEWGD